MYFSLSLSLSPSYLPSLCSLPIQSKVLTEGVALHAQVRPESMKALHERLEEQLKKYTVRYDTTSNGDYEKYEVGYYQPHHPETPPTRRQSNAARRESQKRILSGGTHTNKQTNKNVNTCCSKQGVIVLRP